MQIKDEIHQIAIEFPKYGYRHITKELNRRDFQVNSKRVLGLMREDNLLCIKKTFVPVTTNSNYNHRVYPNIARDMEVTGINQLWVADITYIQLPNAFAESFMKTLKYEEVYLSDYNTFDEAFDHIENFIESVYNEKRLHSGIGYLPPIEFEETLILNMVA